MAKLWTPAIALSAALTLSGCASVDYVATEYGGMQPANFEVADVDTYRVFDKPAANKLMITPSLGRAAGAGFVSGLTFGAVSADDNLGRKPEFERASLAYLKSTGRDCRIMDGYVVIRGQWEFKYDCSVPPTPAPAQPKPLKKR
jgi:hypothetical protein